MVEEALAERVIFEEVRLVAVKGNKVQSLEKSRDQHCLSRVSED